MGLGGGALEEENERARKRKEAKLLAKKHKHAAPVRADVGHEDDGQLGYDVVEAKTVMKRAAQMLEEKGTVKKKKKESTQLEKSKSFHVKNVVHEEVDLSRSKTLPLTKKQYIKADPTTYVDIECAVVNKRNMARFLGFLQFNHKTDIYGECWDGEQAVKGKEKFGGKLGPRVQTLSPHFPPNYN